MKALVAFIAGAVVAAGVAFLAVGRLAQSPTPAPSSAVAPVAEVVPAAPPAATPPVAQPAPVVTPVKAQPPRVAIREQRPEAAPRVETRPAPVEVPQVAAKPVLIEAPAPVAQVERRPEPPKPDPPKPAPPVEPMRVTIPANTTIAVRLDHSISTERVQTGSVFHASLDQPLSIDGIVLAERGAKAEGRITHAEQAGHVKGMSRLTLELTRLTLADGQTVTFSTVPITREPEGVARKEATKVAVGAGIGAALGAIFGGGKGAAIGAGSGAAAGAGTVAMTRNKPLVLPSETRLAFHVNVPLDVVERR
ncbi:MAG: hypothetical protein HYZ37_02315 [Candidatus Solibacter usitatus]|nr:hypothetical protein [Candidatus Solibacter usitatus]